MKVPGGARLNGILLRGFGLTPDSATPFSSKAAVQIGGVAVKRSLLFNTTDSWARFLDSFTNTTRRAGHDRGRLRRPARLQHRHQPERDRDHVERRRRAHARRTRWASFYSPTAGAGSATRQRHQRDGHRHVRPHRQLPARPVHRRAADDRRRGQPLRLRQHAHDPGGRDALARALRRHRPERDAHAGRRRTVPAAGTQVAAVSAKAAALAAAPPLSDLSAGRVLPRSRTSTVAAPAAPPPRPRSAPSSRTRRSARRRARPTTSWASRSPQLKADMASGKTTRAADHARLPGPDRRVRQRPARPALGDHRRAGRDGAGQGRRRRPRRR